MKKHEYEWQQQIQVFIEEIDKGIKDYKDEDLTCFLRNSAILNFILQKGLKKFLAYYLGIM